MMPDYSAYKDKVFGCYIGKSVGGTFGAPYEGMKQRLNVEFSRSIVDKMLVNDDLDLQLLFFSAVKVYGENVSSQILAREFLKNYDFSAGEYAYFKKNFERGILPPYSGSFNNAFYNEGMGAVIRGELWGCLFPCNPQKAMEFAQRDGMIDHSKESVVSIMFISALVSLAFGGERIEKVLSDAISLLPQGKFRTMAESVYNACLTDMSEDDIYSFIISRFGHPDCTNVFQNMGFVIIGLMRLFDSFEKMCSTVNGFGFDTDCTVGICAAIYGVYCGGEALLKQFEKDDIALVTMARCDDYGGSIRAFSEDVAKYGGYFADKFSTGLDGWDNFGFEPASEPYLYPVKYSPTLDENSSQMVELAVINGGSFKKEDVKVTSPKGYSCTVNSVGSFGADRVIRMECVAGEGLESDVALFKISIHGYEFSFGFASPVAYRVSRPFLTLPNTVDLSRHPGYYSAFDGMSGERDENVRKYHLTFVPDYQTEFVEVDGSWAMDKVNLFTDVFKMSDFTSCSCPCTVYVSRTVCVDEDRELRMIVGCEDGMKIWLNGELLVENSEVMMYYPEKFFRKIILKKGENKFVYRLTRSTSSDAAYSVVFSEPGNLMDFPKFALGLKNK